MLGTDGKESAMYDSVALTAWAHQLENFEQARPHSIARCLSLRGIYMGPFDADEQISHPSSFFFKIHEEAMHNGRDPSVIQSRAQCL